MEPIKRGKFSLYETPDGGYHIAYLDELETDGETQHIEIPGFMVKMAKKASESGGMLPNLPNPFAKKNVG